MYQVLTCSSADGHLSCFHILAIVNSAAVNIGVYISFQIVVLSGYMPRSGIAGSYGSSGATQEVLVVKNLPASTGDIKHEV